MGVFTVEEVARRLKLNPQTIYRAIWNKKIHAFKAGRQIRISSQSLNRYLGSEIFNELFGTENMENERKGIDFEANPLLDVEEWACDTGISDLARNHDHYLYGAKKR